MSSSPSPLDPLPLTESDIQTFHLLRLTQPPPPVSPQGRRVAPLSLETSLRTPPPPPAPRPHVVPLYLRDRLALDPLLSDEAFLQRVAEEIDREEQEKRQRKRKRISEADVILYQLEMYRQHQQLSSTSAPRHPSQRKRKLRPSTSIRRASLPLPMSRRVTPPATLHDATLAFQLQQPSSPPIPPMPGSEVDELMSSQPRPAPPSRKKSSNEAGRKRTSREGTSGSDASGLIPSSPTASTSTIPIPIPLDYSPPERSGTGPASREVIHNGTAGADKARRRILGDAGSWGYGMRTPESGRKKRDKAGKGRAGPSWVVNTPTPALD